jgi:hypothetical protein
MAVFAFGFASAPRSNAGTEMIIDNSAQAPPPVYYAPPPVRVVVYPAVRYYVPLVRVYGYQRFYRRHVYCPPNY